MVALAIFASDAAAEWVSATREMMGSEVSVLLWHEDVAEGEMLAGQVFAEVARIEAMMSTYVPESRVSQINQHAAGRPVPANEELFNLIRRSLDISVLTRGAFDITYDSVGQHYDFTNRRRPDQETVDNEQAFIDYRLVELNQPAGTVSFLADGVRINLGGIAKGYVIERGADLLRARGIEHGIVTAGGDSRLLGDRRGRPWMMAVRDPRNAEQVAVSVPLENQAISTSGDFERYFEEDGVRYHHIIEPETGLPASGVRSATVFGPDAVLTDALSTAVFVMGVEQGLLLISTLPDYEGVVIDETGRIHASAGVRLPAPSDPALPEPVER
jgi:thiamine biosynthesis lipoprotein